MASQEEHQDVRSGDDDKDKEEEEQESEVQKLAKALAPVLAQTEGVLVVPDEFRSTSDDNETVEEDDTDSFLDSDEENLGQLRLELELDDKVVTTTSSSSTDPLSVPHKKEKEGIRSLFDQLIDTAFPLEARSSGASEIPKGTTPTSQTRKPCSLLFFPNHFYKYAIGFVLVCVAAIVVGAVLGVHHAHGYSSNNRSAILENDNSVVRINAGTYNEYTDALGRLWEPDAKRNAVFTVVGPGRLREDDCSIPIQGANELFGDIYCTRHVLEEVGGYDIKVPSYGNYTVVLHFADTFRSQPGVRQFDITLNDRMVANQFDIVQHVGRHTALTLSTTAMIHKHTTGGKRLRLRLHPQRNYPIINGMEVYYSEYTNVDASS